MSQRNEEYQRYEFIYDMERLYLQAPFSDEEIGERLGTDRSNVWRIRKIMTEKMAIPIDPHPTERGKWYIHPEYSITHIPFNREQMAALYLAARRLQQQTRTSQLYVVDALEKLAHALRKPLAENLVKAAQYVFAQEQDPQQQQIFATLVQCWLDRLPVRITHRKLHGEPRVYRVHPYQIEPAVWGDGNYLIGYSEYHGKLATFKLSRIEKVVIGTGEFEIPAEFNVYDLLKYAWGVWHADEEPVTVKLRFNKWAVPRLSESIWHPNAILHDPAADGSCEWEVQVAEWREMFSWVKGWGSNVTILEPAEMVEEMKREVRRWVRNYQIVELPTPPTYQLLWAKTGGYDRTHPLICHLIDVGQAALALWKEVFTDSLRTQIADALSLPVDDGGRLVAYWAALHDLGKASPAFQRKYEPAIERLTVLGLPFPKLIVYDPCYHATITTKTLPDRLVEIDGTLRPLAEKIAQALGGHHGVWPTEKEVMDGLKEVQVGSGAWDTVRRDLVQALYQVYRPPTVHTLPIDPIESNAFLTLFSGITSVADWIGSMESYFPFEEVPIDVEGYATTALQRAQNALRDLGWCAWQPPAAERTFVQLFGVSPRPMQEKVVELATRLHQPSLVIIEAPTGTGKTEAALYLADQWAHKFQQRGLYVAMPTMATSNQMHGRVKQVLHDRYPEQMIEPLLVHSQARWQRESPPPDLTITDERPQQNASVVDMSWFLPTKRSLLAPFAVGTVDQTLLSVLLTRHFFVRLFALSHKTVIFDEVHAYDTYMTALFQRLLPWLRAMGASVVLLSATLPAKSRKALLGAWLENEALTLPTGDYPAIWWASGDRCEVEQLQSPESRSLQLTWLNRVEDEIVATLRNLLQNGGCAAVICNTVARAQTVYKALERANIAGLHRDDLILFHARSPFGWRDETEKTVLNRFGKKGDRPSKAIVVATQVIEQSLDLDFDVMISDLAPIDLLIQRAGRLHRHGGRTRPSKVVEPQLFVAIAQKPDDMPDLEADVYVYEPLILYRSYLALQGKGALILPQETSHLIELVYGEDQTWTASLTPDMEAALEKAKEILRKHNEKADHEASKRLVLPPAYKQLLFKRNDQLEEEDASVHQSLQALTRLGPPTVALVCLHKTASGLNTEPDGSGLAINETERPDAETTQSLARCTVSVNHQGIVQFLLSHGKAPACWNDHSLLRNNHYLLRFQNGLCRLEGCAYSLKLTKAYGLEIIKEER
jgi:CRISPR-associated endonuclease/helicase Cas3